MADERLQKAIDAVTALRIEYGLIWDDYCRARDIPDTSGRYASLFYFKTKLVNCEDRLVTALVELQLACGYENLKGLIGHAEAANHS